jgi:hypothetical protein
MMAMQASRRDSTSFRPTAVCVIRSEPRDDDTLLISITMTPDVERGRQPLIRRVTEPAVVLQIVAAFLDEIQLGHDASNE